MTVRTVSNLPAATHGETVRCLFAIELSKQRWIIGSITPLSTRIGRRILSGGDWKGLLKLIDEVRARVSLEMGRTVESRGFALARTSSIPTRTGACKDSPAVVRSVNLAGCPAVCLAPPSCVSSVQKAADEHVGGQRKQTTGINDTAEVHQRQQRKHPKAQEQRVRMQCRNR